MTIWSVSLGVAALGWLALAWAGIRTAASLPHLRSVPTEPPRGAAWPRVSVIAAARDERQGVGAATRSLLALDYPDLEVLVVDDRSTDGTGAILDELSTADPRLRVVHVGELPDAWLGKCHACHVGASRASGEWLLFTDGDVVFGPDVLRRAVGFAEAHRLDHLVAFPHMIAPGFLERAFVSTFALFLLPMMRPWLLRRSRGRAFAGVGAFNMVRRGAYERVGGHARIALEIVDDVKLGLLLRRSGARQGALDGDGDVRVRWNRGFTGSWRGLLKNSFAGCEWRWGYALAGVAVLLDLALAPLLGTFLAPGVALRALAATTLAGSMATVSLAARRVAGGRGLEGLAVPVSVSALAAALLASAALAALRGGVVWRGTHYPLASLQAGCLRDWDVPTDGVVGW